jgi:hypothetical protein
LAGKEGYIPFLPIEGKELSSEGKDGKIENDHM